MGSEAASCFICGSSSVVLTNEVKFTSTNNGRHDLSEMSEKEREAYHQQEKVVLGHSVFVIRVLFQVPPIIFLDKESPPIVSGEGVIERMGFCRKCSDSVDKAYSVYREMLEMLQNFRRIQLELVGKVKKRKNGDEMECRKVHGKWRKFIGSYEYGADTDTFLLEDFNSTVESLSLSLQSASIPYTDSFIEVKSEYLEDDDFTANVSDDEFQLDDKESGTRRDDPGPFQIEEKKLPPNYSDSEDPLESDQAVKGDPEPHAISRNEEKEMSTIPCQVFSEEEDEWVPDEDPLAPTSNDSSPSSAESSEEEYVPKKKKARRQRTATARPQKSKRTPPTKASFTCTRENCSNIFTSKTALKKHVRQHHKTPETFSTFNCPSCPRSFKQFSSLRTHICHTHPTNPILTCPEKDCNRTFKTSKALATHSRVHKTISATRRRHFPCPEEGCGKVFTASDILRIHISKHKNDPQYECKLCHQKVFTPQQLQRHHQKVHLSEDGANNAFVCETCGKRFSCYPYLHMHRKKSHEDGQDASDASPVICDLCGKTYPGKFNLYIHVRTVHEKKYSTNKKSFFCEHCGKGYWSLVLLRHHLYTIHGIGTEEDRRVIEKREVKCRCEVVGCRLKFYGEMAHQRFKKHMDEFHGEDGKQKRFKCDQCPSQFSNFHKFRAHQAIHFNKDTKPFKCETCGKGFANRAYLRYHQLNTHKAPRLLNRRKETKPRDFIRKNEDGKAEDSVQ